MQNNILAATPAAAHRPAAGMLRVCGVIAAAALLSGCGSVYQSNFAHTPIGIPPARTATAFGAPGSVLVAEDQTGQPDHWVWVSRTADQSGANGLEGTFGKPIGPGEYSFTAHMFVPWNATFSTLRFETKPQAGAAAQTFLTLDLTPDNKVRIDGNEAAAFGSFPRNQIFILWVNLDLRSSTPTARVSLSGFGARGTADYTIPAQNQALAQQFGAVSLSIGAPYAGQVYATDIKVRAGTAQPPIEPAPKPFILARLFNDLF